MQKKIRTKPLKFRASRSAKQQVAGNGVRERRSACISSTYVHGSFPFKGRARNVAQNGHSGGRAQRGSPEPMNTGLWNMDSGLAAAPRPGMTVDCADSWWKAASGPSPAGLAGIRSGRKVPRARPCAGHPRLPWQARDNVKTWMPGPSPGTGDFLDAGCGANSAVNGLRPVQSAGNTALAEARTRHRDTERAKEL
jgi:hypothetical protein